MPNEQVIEALERGLVLFDAVIRFIDQNPVSDYTVEYDGAACDGSCLGVDCGIASAEIDEALAALRAQQSDLTAERERREKAEATWRCFHCGQMCWESECSDSWWRMVQNFPGAAIPSEESGEEPKR